VSRRTAGLALLLLAACRLETPSGPDQGLPGGPVVPTATAPGTPQGAPSSASIGVAGGALDSPGGALRLTVPAGAVPGPTSFTVTPISSRAPGALGGAWRVEAGGPLAGPVQLAFRGLGGYRAGLDVRSLAVRFQDARGFWVAPGSVSWDPAGDAVTVTTPHLSDWTLVLAGTPALEGTFSLVQSVGLPFPASGTAALYAWPDGAEPTWFLTGTITLPSPLAAAGLTCVPDEPTKALDLSVAEVHGALFRWGLAARWALTCTDEVTGAVSSRDLPTTFDTMQIALLRCPGQYLGTQVNGPAFVQGSYRSDCGAEGAVTATWDFRACTPGGACQPDQPCRSGTVTCALGVGTCTAGAGPASWLADGTPCSSATVPAGTCLAGDCR
jgi:hypothetical protein